MSMVWMVHLAYGLLLETKENVPGKREPRAGWRRWHTSRLDPGLAIP
jgi:hypothetical protein